MELRTITEYRTLIDQSLNIGNLYRQGEFSFLSSKEKDEQLQKDYQRALSQGKVNGK